MIEIQQEPEQVPARPMYAAIMVVILIMAGASVVVFLLSRSTWFEPGGRTRREAPLKQVPAEASQVESQVFRLETPSERGAREARKRLQGYGWVDKRTGRVHIPIEVATRLYLSERGAP